MPVQTNYHGIYAQSSGHTRSNEDFARCANTHLDAINSGTTGNQLLRQISELARRSDHKLTICKSDHPTTEPVLSRSQRERHPNLTSYSTIRETAGRAYALKKSWRANEGCSAIICWSSRVSKTILDSDGDAIGHEQSTTDMVSTLGHELVHAKHMMAGTWKGSYEDPLDSSTNAGKEELRAVGLGKYKYRKSHEPSENSIRAEHGLPKRRSYSWENYRTDSE